MTDWQLKELEKAEEILTALYWDMIDNHDDARQTRRLDTILGKLDALKKLN